MLTLYHAPNSRSMRIVWLLEELGLEYDLKLFKLGDKAMRDPEYLKLNPNGRVPTLIDGDVRLHESGAIVQYLLDVHGSGKMVPEKGTQDFARYLQWLHYAEGMIMPQVNLIMVETFFLPEERRNAENLSRAQKLLTRSLIGVENEFGDGDYIAGDFSGADIMCGHACVVSGRLGADISDKPKVAAYIDRLKARPALQKAMET